jgi:hypothetical protein
MSENAKSYNAISHEFPSAVTMNKQRVADGRCKQSDFAENRTAIRQQRPAGPAAGASAYRLPQERPWLAG